MMRSFLRMAAVFAAVLPGIAAAENVVTYHNGENRRGAYKVPGLTASAAATMHLDTGFSGAFTGNVYAQPLYYKAAGTHPGAVIVTTESNLVAALNATTGAVDWQTQLPASVPGGTLPCGNISPEGITGTPAIDPATATLYIDALVTTANGPRQQVFALNVTTGQILAGYPLDVQSALSAQGVTFDSTVEGERSALLFHDGNLYISYGGRSGDCGSYHGVVVQVTPGTKPAVTGNWYTRAVKGGIWSQGGAAADGTSIFVTTGNTAGASSFGDGEAIVRLKPGLAHSTNTADFVAPSNWLSLDQSDSDLGGTEAIPIDVPDSGGTPAHRLIAFGKDGNAYLANRKNLGGIGGFLAILPVAGSVVITGPAVYNTANKALVAFRTGSGKACSGSSINMLSIAPTGTTPMSLLWCIPLSGAGAPIVTTSDGTNDPLVWITGAEGDNKLHAYNALTGATVYTSAAGMQGLRHFSTLIAADKRLYVAADNKVYAYTFTQ